ncbi:hypothetical protein AVEN_266874-1 [Araneus ventricosus]|uniref:Uncharacterized protein n=1 Tax=Araneus ventricosus TaxID=182803 RepID=A0A4Y2SWS9_ARAVE|nr:hypothetical protein AVEN_266874-1 [Araneus ventricosus]
MAERDIPKDWDCHRALVRAAVERENKILSRMRNEIQYSLDEILSYLKYEERWKNIEATAKEIEFEREYLILTITRGNQFYNTIIRSIRDSTEHLIQCMNDEFVTDVEPIGDLLPMWGLLVICYQYN